MERATAADPRLQALSSLTDVQWRQRFEASHGLCVAEGAKVIDRALQAGLVPTLLVGHDRWLPDLERWQAATTHAPDVLVASHDDLQAVTGYHVHRGALGVFERPRPHALADVIAGARRLVIVEDVVDHSNMGAIFRIGAALGVDGVVLSPRCADPLYRRSLKVSMGAVFGLPWTRAERWPDAIDEVRRHGITVAALVVSEEATDLRDFPAAAPDRLAFMVGTEGAGLTRGAVNASERRVTIPMARGTDSLNVAQALCVALWSCSPQPSCER